MSGSAGSVDSSTGNKTATAGSKNNTIANSTYNADTFSTSKAIALSSEGQVTLPAGYYDRKILVQNTDKDILSGRYASYNAVNYRAGAGTRGTTTSTPAITSIGTSGIELGVNTQTTLPAGYYSKAINIRNGVYDTGSPSKQLTVSSPSYTIPAGYHNGTGKVTVKTTSINETAGTSDRSISANDGFITGVTIKPTPSQAKSQSFNINRTGSTTVTPDSGKLLSSATVTATCTAAHESHTLVNGSATYKANGTYTVYPGAGGNAMGAATITVDVTGGECTHSFGTKTITPGSSDQTFSASSDGYSGYSSVTVKAAAGEAHTIKNPATTTVTENNKTYTLTPGSGGNAMTSAKVKVAIPKDGNLKAENIKKGVKIDGVTGTYEGSSTNSFTVTLHSYSKDENSSEVAGNGCFELPASAKVSKVELISASNNDVQSYTYVNVKVDGVLKSPMGYDHQQYTAVTMYKDWDGKTWHWINSSEANVDPKTINVDGKALSIRIGSDGSRNAERDVTAKFKIYFQ